MSAIDTRCSMVTVQGARCSNTGSPVIGSERANPALRSFNVCHRHEQEFRNDIYWEVAEVRQPNAAIIAQIVIRAERNRHREAKRLREAAEVDIQRIVDAQLNAPTYDPRKKLA